MAISPSAYGGPTGQDVADFLGRGNDAGFVDLAWQHVTAVTAMAHAYTRGRGFQPEQGPPYDDVAAVIVTATARLLANPSRPPRPPTVQHRAGFTGWSLAKTFVLNRYRKRAA